MASPVDRDLLHSRLEPVVGGAGFDLEDLEVAQVGRRLRLRLLVDRDGGVTLDECAEVSRLVEGALDGADDVLGDAPYTLEVSSPGVSRPLTLPRHWRRNTGRLVTVRRRAGAPLTGRVRGVDDSGVVLEVEGADSQRVRLAYDEVSTARVQVELRRDEPGG